MGLLDIPVMSNCCSLCYQLLCLCSVSLHSLYTCTYLCVHIHVHVCMEVVLILSL